MKLSTKIASIAGTAIAMMPLAARAADDMTSTDYSSTPAAVDTATTSAATAGGLALFGGSIIFLLVMIVLNVALFVFWIFMLIDVFKRTNWKQESDKTLWILLVILLGYLGAIVYYFVVKRQLDAKKK